MSLGRIWVSEIFEPYPDPNYFKQRCGARAGAVGGDIIWDLEPEPKFFKNKYVLVSVEDATVGWKTASIETYFLWYYC